MKRTYSLDEARDISQLLKIDFARSGFDLEQFRSGLDVEAEHGQVDPATNVTDDDPLTTGKIALAHLNEISDYYTRLQQMEAGAESVSSLEVISTLDSISVQPARAKKLLFGLFLIILSAMSIRSLRQHRGHTV